MALTRADAETVCLRRCKGYMQRAGLDVTTVAGANPDLNDPLASALTLMGIPPADRNQLTDADFAILAGAAISAYLDIGELCVLRSLWGRLHQVDTRVGPRSENLSQLRKDLAEWLDTLSKTVQRQWGHYLVVPIVAGDTAGGIAKIRAV